MNRGNHVESAKVAGLEPGSDVIGIGDAIIDGNFPTEMGLPDSLDGSVMIGSRLAQRLNAVPGDIIRLVSPRSIRTSRVTGAPTPVYWLVRVSGVFETGMYIYDNEFLVMSRQTAQDFTGLGDAVSTLSVRVADPMLAPMVAASIEERLGYPYHTETWQQQNSQLFSALQLEKIGMGLVIFFIMLVAAFNIVGTLTMVVAFKTREIGILQAMGLEPAGIGRIFLAQGGIIGIVGTSIGLVLGLAVAWVVDTSGLIRLDPAVYFIDRLPIRTDPLDIGIIVVTALALAIVATIHPARQAAALSPVEAVRAE